MMAPIFVPLPDVGGVGSGLTGTGASSEDFVGSLIVRVLSLLLEEAGHPGVDPNHCVRPWWCGLPRLTASGRALPASHRPLLCKGLRLLCMMISPIDVGGKIERS